MNEKASPKQKASRVQPSAKDALGSLIRRADLHARQVGLDLALYDPLTTKLHLLNATAAAVWNHLTRGRTTKNITEALALTFGKRGNEVEELDGDVRWVIRQFEMAGLLIPKGEAPKRGKAAKPERIAIPDREISSISGGYIRPGLKSYTIEELNKVVQLDECPVALFSDVYLAEPPTS